MESYKPNIHKKIVKHTDARNRIEDLEGQMGEMHNDYQDMIRAREEYKKQLEAKFQDVLRKIQSTRDYVNAEGKRVNDMLKAFQSKFEYQMNELKNFTSKKFEEEKKLRESTQAQNSKRLDELNEMLSQEKEDRKRHTINLIGPIKESVDTLVSNFRTEISERTSGYRAILEKLQDEEFRLTEKLKKEVSDRTIELTKLGDQAKKDVRTSEKDIEKFQQSSLRAMEDTREGLEEEMTSRLDQQDEIIDNTSNFLKTFQDTLKVLTTNA